MEALQLNGRCRVAGHEAVLSWDPRLPTGQLNAWIKEVLAATPVSVRGGKQPRILLATRATNQPPTLVFFTPRFPEVGYRWFPERRLLATFGVDGCRFGSTCDGVQAATTQAFHRGGSLGGRVPIFRGEGKDRQPQNNRSGTNSVGDHILGSIGIDKDAHENDGDDGDDDTDQFRLQVV